MTDAELHALAERMLYETPRNLIELAQAAHNLAIGVLRLKQERDYWYSHYDAVEANWLICVQRAEKAEADLEYANDRAAKEKAVRHEAYEVIHVWEQRALKAEAELAAIRKLCTNAGMTEDSLPEHYLVGVFSVLKKTQKTLAKRAILYKRIHTLRRTYQDLQQFYPVIDAVGGVGVRKAELMRVLKAVAVLIKNCDR